MQLTCPNCDTPIPSANINIQQMSAVCPNCNTIFQFEPPRAESSRIKNKHRKVKQPQRLTLDETDEALNLSFRTNFRLDKNEAFLSGTGLSIVFTFITLFMIDDALGGDLSVIMPLMFGSFTLFLYYWSALIAYNRTHIQINDEEIKVERKPLPNPLNQPKVISLSQVETIRCEETNVSRKEAYDTPRFNVWAETVNGTRRIIVSNVVEEYALFITQVLNERLIPDDTAGISRLMEDEWLSDDEHADESAPPQNQAHKYR